MAINVLLAINQQNPKLIIRFILPVYGRFANEAYYGDLKKAGVGQIVACNTIEHTSNAIDLSVG